MSHSQFDLLSKKRFLPLFVTQFLGAFNDNVFKNALVMLITYYAASKVGMDSRILVVASAGIFILPFFLFSALAGQLIDAHEKSQFIRKIKIIEIGLMILASIGFYIESVNLLMFVLFLMGTQSAFFGPVKYSILPDHLHKGELISGNALIEAGTFISILLGTILGGILILRDGGVLYVSIIIIFMSVLGYLASRYVPKAEPKDKGLKINYNIFTASWDIVQHTRKQPDVFLSIVGISWFWLVGFIFLSQFPIYGKDVMNGDETVATLFLAVFSVGIALGSLLCNKLLDGEVNGTYVPLGAFGMSAFILLFWWLSPEIVEQVDSTVGLITAMDFFHSFNHILILLTMVIVAIFGGIYIVPLYAIMQSRCDEEYRSRTVAANNIINSFFMVMGALLTLLMLKMNLQVTDIFLVVGLVNIPVGFLVKHLVHAQQKKIREA